MLENAINIEMEESINELVIKNDETLNNINIECLKEMNYVSDIESINVFNMMITLEKIKRLFLERRIFVQKKVNQLDFEIQQKQLDLAIVLDIETFKELKESIDELVKERKKLLLEKKLIKKIDINNQFTYGMIGMAINAFKNITRDLDWEEMKL